MAREDHAWTLLLFPIVLIMIELLDAGESLFVMCTVFILSAAYSEFTGARRKVRGKNMAPCERELYVMAHDFAYYTRWLPVLYILIFSTYAYFYITKPTIIRVCMCALSFAFLVRNLVYTREAYQRVCEKDREVQAALFQVHVNRPPVAPS